MSGNCFSLGPMRGLSFSQYKQYQAAWQIFNQVYTYNANVSTIMGINPTAQLSYWRFVDTREIQQYRQGQNLHTIAYPSSNWTSIGTG